MTWIRVLAGLLMGVLVTIPLRVSVTTPVLALAVTAGALGGVGVVRDSLRLVRGAAGLILIAYAGALWITAALVAVGPALAFGLVLALLFMVVGFAAQFREAPVDTAVIQGQVRAWLAMTAIAGLAAGALALGGGVLLLRLPAGVCPVLAALGALAAVVAGRAALLELNGMAVAARRAGAGR
jgi:hypothetical protein